MIESYPPNRLYLLKTTNQRVTLYSYNEDNTVTVDILKEYNLTMIEKRVFGVPLDDLVECDLPSPNEQLGVILTEPEEIEEYIEILKTKFNKKATLH